MLGSSRESLVAVRELLAGSAVDEQFGDELLAIATLLHAEPSLRGALSDPGTSLEMRAGVLDSTLRGRIRDDVLVFAGQVVGRRWSHGGDLVEAFGTLGAEALFMQAETDGRLDTVQNELFSFARTVDSSGELQLVLGNPAVNGAERSAVVRQLVEGKVQPETLLLLQDVVAHPRGRRLDDALAELVELAAVRRHELLAQVTAAIALDEAQEQRLTDALARIYGQPVQLQVIVDPSVVGGVSVTINEEVIDGTTVHRLEQARRLLVGGQG
jgi:F-type H+-transporting ATPase subunit delta